VIMNIQDIKKEALYFLNKNKQKMINVCLIIGVISSLSSLLPITGPYTGPRAHRDTVAAAAELRAGRRAR